MRVNKRLVGAIRRMGEVHRTKLRHQHDDVRKFYEQFRGAVIVAFEASGYSAWFEQMLAELGHTVWLGNAAEISRKAPRKQKNDRRDADLMLDLLMKSDFPRVHTFSTESRTVLRQLRYRHKLVKVRTIAKNSVHAIGINAGLPLRGRLLTQRGMEQLQVLPLSPVLSQQRDEWLALIRLMNKQIGAVEESLEQRAKDDEAVELLRTHPGIGLLTALALRYTLDPISRFTPRGAWWLTSASIVSKINLRSTGGWAALANKVRACCAFCSTKLGKRPREKTRS
jgi:transposase